MGTRPDRVAEAIKRLVSEVIYQGLKDPRVRSVTIVKVEMTPDIRLATVYYSVLGNQADQKAVAAGLKSAKPFIKRHVGANINLRYVPEIVFKSDRSSEYRSRIDDILNKISKEKKNERNKEGSKGD